MLQQNFETERIYKIQPDGTIKLIARVNPGGSKWFYHADHLGSTSLITNQSGGIVEEIFYLPYGEPIGNSDGEIRLYEGKEYNDELNQYYFGARGIKI